MARTGVKRTGSGEPKRISGLLEDLFGRLGITRQYNGWSVVSQWPSIVGEMMAARSEAVKFDDGVLIVSVRDDAWRQELSLQKEDILQKIKSLPHGSAVKQIRLIRGRKG